MPRRTPSVTKPVTIVWPNGKTHLTTVFDFTINKHRIECDLCKLTIVLTKTAHPRAIFDHRGKKSCDRQRLLLEAEGEAEARRVLPPLPSSSSVWLDNVPQVQNTPKPKYPSHNTNVHAPMPPAPTVRKPQIRCPGSAIKWTPGSVWATYPYQQHKTRNDVGWKPFGFGMDDTIILRSDKCAGFATDVNAACSACHTIQYTASFQKFVDRAQEAKAHTPWEYLSADQMQAVMKKMAAQLRILRTKASSFGSGISYIADAYFRWRIFFDGTSHCSYKSAKQFSSPCTNVPINCPLCPLSVSGQPHTVWKYNCVYHIITHHSTKSSAESEEAADPVFSGKLPDIPAQLTVDLFISRQEERCMEVSEKATADARQESGMPNSEGFEVARKQLPKEKEKRPRSQTVTSGGGRKKKNKK